MDERNEGEKVEEVMLPGFRFHPTDEELVGFYLKRKIQQRPLSIELIKQLDIYKYDPWDLPKLASTGEKEWYFYCPRDRKYRNSARPNRVTGAGFWKATGTDRPVYSSEGNKCIGLKKSLVFYKGRAAKGVKTEWMMHEFRLPSLIDSSSPNRFMDKNVPPSDSWAICRIFKKSAHLTAQRMAHHQSSHSQSPETYLQSPPITFDPTEPLITTETNGPTSTSMQHPICTDNNLDLQSQPSPLISTCPLDDLIASSYRTTLNPTAPMAFSENGDFLDLTNTSNGLLSQLFSLPPSETTSELLSTIDVSSILQNMSSSVLFGDFGRIDESVNSYSAPEGHPPYHDGFLGPEFPQQESTLTDNSFSLYKEDQQWETVRTGGSGLNGSDAWKWSSIGGLGWWDSPSCPGELSTLFSTTKCHT